MGALSAFFGGLFTILFVFLARYLTAKLLIAAAAIATFTFILIGLNSVFSLLMSSITLSLPAEYQWGLGMMPDNISVCVSTIITARTALYLAYVKWSFVKIKVNS